MMLGSYKENPPIYLEPFQMYLFQIRNQKSVIIHEESENSSLDLFPHCEANVHFSPNNVSINQSWSHEKVSFVVCLIRQTARLHP